MLVESSVPDPAALTGGGTDLHPDSSSAPFPGPLDFPYNVSPTLYPDPTYISSSSNTSDVQLFDLSTSASAFGMVNVSSSAAGYALWFESSAFSAALAKQIFLAGSNPSPSTLPLSWSSPVRVATFSNAVTADEATAIGSTLLVAATTAGSTQVYSSTSLGSSWAPLGSAVSGTVRSLSASPTEYLLETSSSTSVTLASFALTGSTVGSVSEAPGGSASLLSAGSVMEPTATGYAEMAAYTLPGTGAIEFTTSTTGGVSFSTPVEIGNFAGQVPNPLFDRIGDTDLIPPDTASGQIALATSPSGLLLAYTTENVSGATELLTISSANQGTTWTKPEQVGPVIGTIQNLTLTASPAGLVYAIWHDPDDGSGGIDQATLMGNGYPIVPPTELPGLSQSGSEVPGAPSIAVDGFSRPLVAWPAGPGNPSAGVFVTGDFLSPARSLALLEQLVSDPLVPSNFVPPANGATVTAFIEGVSQNASAISSELAARSLCNAQNTSVISLYASLTHVSLVVANASTTCAPRLAPSNSVSSIINDTGVDAPNSYLATYADWLLESEAVPVPSSPLVNLTAFPIFSSAAPAASSGSASLLGSTQKVTVSPSLYSPTSTELAITTNALPTAVSESSETDDFIRCVETGDSAQEYYEEGGSLSKTTTQVSVDSGATGTVTTGTNSYPSTVWLTHLTPDSTHTYMTHFTATYSGTSYYYEPSCPSNGDSTPESWSGSMEATATGTVATTLSFTASGALFHASFTKGSTTASVSFAWGTTMPSIARGELLDQSTGSSVSSSTSSYATTGAFGAWTEPLNETYTASLTAQSRPGTTPGSQTPAYAEVAGLTSPAENATTTCQLDLAEPDAAIWTVPGVGLVSGENATSALVEFGSNNSHILGFADAEGYETSDVHAVANPNGNGSYLFPIELDGLEPWSYYSFTYGYSFGAGCVSDWVSYTSSQLIQTLPEFAVSERDLPYDSLTQTGGGAQFGWSIPQWFAAEGPSFEVASVSYEDTSAKSGLAVLNLTSPLPATPVGSDNYVLNLSLTGINDSYSIAVNLHFWISGANWTNASGEDQFIYEHDTTGDGLTNLEKENGWTVTYSDDLGSNMSETVTANPNAYATNGLVSDYLEKLYGLNPNTVDTAGSRMLDTWNLTFLLGPDWNVPSSTYFTLRNESTTYRPFAAAVNAAPGIAEDGHPLDKSPFSWSNVTATPGGGLHSGDGSPNASKILWSYGALQTFVNLPAVQRAVWFDANFDLDGGGFGAVIGMWNNSPTITIWGKLSWGDDPLVASTLGNGLPDGARISPVGRLGLSLTISNLYATGLNTGQGYAASIEAFYGSTASPLDEEFSNYSATVGLGIGSSNGAGSGGAAKFARLSGYRVILPVSQTYQMETVQIGLVANLTGSSALTRVPLNYNYDSSTLYFEENITYDMVAGQVVSEAYSCPANKTTVYDSASGHDMNGTISLTMQSYLEGEKATTYLWLPNTTSTVNGLPTGLERYIGEQSFELVAVNASQGYFSSATIPAPFSGSYTVSLTKGLNNFLIPREQFFDSPFAAAVLLGKDFPYPASNPTPPILLNDASARSILTTQFGDTSGLMFDIEAYWQNRSILPGTTVSFMSGELGTANSSSLQVSVLGVIATVANNTGGLTEDQGIYQNASVSAPPALQTVITLNITSNATLDLLLAALLDNTTGTQTGVNGSFQLVTSLVATLGLGAPVVSALANAAPYTEGLFGPPTYSAPASRSSNTWGAFWNAGVAVLTNPLGTVVSLIETGVGWVEAAVLYADQLWHEALAIGGQTVNRLTSALTRIGSEILAALLLFLEYLIQKASGLLSSVLDPVGQAAREAEASWFSQWVAVSNSVDNFYGATGNQRQADQSTAVEEMEPAIMPMLETMGAVTAVFVVVTTLLGPFDFAGGLVGGIVLSVMIAAFSVGLSGALGSGTSPLSTASSLVFGYVSSLTESFFNLTEAPLNSSTAMAIAVPDGDPWEALSIIAGLVGGLAVIYAAGADAFGGGLSGGVLAAMMIGCLLAFFGIGLAFDAALSAANLPPPSNNLTVRQDYQADSGIALIAGTVAATGLIVCAATAKLGGPDVLLSTAVSGVVSVAVLAFGFLTIWDNHSEEGTYP
jgi:hypothetical protein